LTNTMTGKDFKNILSAPVRVGRHAIIGTGSVVLPGVYIGEGCAIGAMSLVRSSTKPWTINVGIPCREIKERSRRLLEMEQRFLIKRSHTQ